MIIEISEADRCRAEGFCTNVADPAAERQVTLWQKPQPTAPVTSGPEVFFELWKQRKEHEEDACF
ncbi:hypothetical protein H1230_17425 [Paenibacillus sp. 19GGS1-52]|uniref:hypothetical protein n=1 Tax=Paenibacillus sp. 19GGS1-52 TaxID=2758563 RepID=UPI001EFA7FA1|nr:hypothetical protein [Paenibacillus sp. 19GGS1-52]ULO04914.1 hypothetical protein H1230_17425 [Paenibacillus sp. 19GGS1-52]